MAGVISQPSRVRLAKKSGFCLPAAGPVVTVIKSVSNCSRRVMGAFVIFWTAFGNDCNCEDVTGPVGREQPARQKAIGMNIITVVRKAFMMSDGQRAVESCSKCANAA